jgi:hypothetical protein
MAIEQGRRRLTTGSTGAPEKQSVDWELATSADAGEYGLFGRK